MLLTYRSRRRDAAGYLKQQMSASMSAESFVLPMSSCQHAHPQRFVRRSDLARCATFEAYTEELRKAIAEAESYGVVDPKAMAGIVQKSLAPDLSTLEVTVWQHGQKLNLPHVCNSEMLHCVILEQARRQYSELAATERQSPDNVASMLEWVHNKSLLQDRRECVQCSCNILESAIMHSVTQGILPDEVMKLASRQSKLSI
eukprot:6060362-Amphidinium_carterae.1